MIEQSENNPIGQPENSSAKQAEGQTIHQDHGADIPDLCALWKPGRLEFFYLKNGLALVQLSCKICQPLLNVLFCRSLNPCAPIEHLLHILPKKDARILLWSNAGREVQRRVVLISLRKKREEQWTTSQLEKFLISMEGFS